MKHGNLHKAIEKKRKKTPLWVPVIITFSFYAALFLYLFLEPFSRITEDSVNYITLNTDVMQFEEEGGSGMPSFTSINRKINEEGEIKSITAAKASTADAGVNISDTTSTKLNNEGAVTPDTVNRSSNIGDTLNYMDYYSGSSRGGNGGSGVLASNLKLPEFMGGDFNVFRGWFLKRLRVPLDPPKEIVMVSFSVDKNGVMQNIKVRSCSSMAVRDEILRLLRNAPKWEPGLENGLPAGFNFQMPVNFKHYQ
jgi:hypothetical protein